MQVKALLISRNFPPTLGGSCVVYQELCRRMSPDVEVLAAAFDPERESDWDGGQPYRIFRSRSLAPPPPARGPLSSILRSARVYLWKRPCAVIAAWRSARKSRPELVCIGSFTQYWLAGFFRRVLGLPVIFYIHGEELTSPDTSRLAGPRGFFSALRKADGVIAVSRFTRSRLIEIGVGAGRIELIPNGVDLGRFTPGERDPEIVDRYGLRGKRVLLTVGRLEERKGHATVLRALPQILRSCPDAIYAVVGTGDGLPDLGLDALARKLGISDHVVFAGQAPPERLCAFYRSCDLFVMPNRTLPNGDTEGFGLVFLEAAACGKPVIGGRDGGVPDAVVDGETGILVNGASAEEFADAAVRLLTDPDLAARLGSQGFRRAQEMSWDGAAGTFLSFCAKVIQGRALSPGPPQPDGGTGTQTDAPAAPRNEL